LEGSVADWREIGTKPVSSESAAGVSARYDPDFELLDAQIQKLEGFSREAVDWPQVAALGRKILEQKSKDILVCSYVAVGLLQTEGFSGLTKGLACLEGMISGHWPGLFPELKRLKARVNAVNWLAAKAGSAIAQGAVKAGAGEAAAACEAQVKSLLALLQEKIPADCPDFVDLLRPLQEFTRQNVPKQAAAAPEAETISRPEPQSPAPSVTPAAVETAEDARRFLSEMIDPLKQAISISRGGEPAAAAPYYLIRALTWSDVDTLPPAVDNLTRIPPPPAHYRDHCRALAGQSAWKELLGEVEDRVAEFPFWLDLHRMSDQALAGLGPDYAGARSAVRAEVISLLTRLPELSELKFSDGTLFADDSTRRWISMELFPAPENTAAAVSGAESELLANLREKTRELMREGKHADAISLAQEALKTTSAERDRFLIQLDLARLCLEAGQLKPALARLEVVDEQIHRFSLEAWEPNLCVEALRLYWEALNQSANASRQPAPEMIRQADAVYSRLCKVDVMAGLHLTKASRR